MGNFITRQRLRSKTTKSVELFKMKGIYDCKVVEVYDGDTITIVIYNRFQFEKHKLRMLGYDSAEMNPRKKNNMKEINDERERALNAKLFLSDIVLDKICKVELNGKDNFGRLLGDLYIKQNWKLLHQQTRTKC